MNTFPRLTVEELLARFSAPRTEVDETVARIVADVRVRGELAVREYAERFDGLEPGAALNIDRQAMRAALDDLAFEARERLTRIALRIRRFAEKQRESLLPMIVDTRWYRGTWDCAGAARGLLCTRGTVPSAIVLTHDGDHCARGWGIRGLDRVAEVAPDHAGMRSARRRRWIRCGRRRAGHRRSRVRRGPDSIMRHDCWAGKRVCHGCKTTRRRSGGHRCTGRSVIIADDIADPALVAADLLAQAEHDPWSIPILVTWSDRLIRDVERELDRRLTTLPTAEVARAALSNGGAILVRYANESAAVSDAVAPEHLHLHVEHPEALAAKVRNYGALFIGGQSAEVLGDYGAGPNHVLPTGRAARFSGGLSAFSFLRVRTWLSVDDEHAARELYEDAAWLARCEGLEAHARSSEARLTKARVKA